MTTPPFAALRRLAAQRPQQEQCELCSAPLREEHRHLVEPSTRQLVCACDPCSILFSGQSDTRYRLVPSRVRYLEGFVLPDEVWDSLLIPVNMAFFFCSTAAGRVVALYPSPAGATESQLDLDAWTGLEVANPILRELEPDVEALLVNRIGKNREHFLAPIDRCYQLVGLIRAGWKGLSGGTEVWSAIDGFFSDLRARATALQRPAG